MTNSDTYIYLENALLMYFALDKACPTFVFEQNL